MRPDRKLGRNIREPPKVNIKLNPEKCVFGLPKGKPLGYIMSEHGIEANPKKIMAISNMGPIHNVKGVQSLTGCLAALSRFISWLGERGMPLYKLLKKTDVFIWTEEAQQSLESLKASLMLAPILVAPKRGESLRAEIPPEGPTTGVLHR